MKQALHPNPPKSAFYQRRTWASFMDGKKWFTFFGRGGFQPDGPRPVGGYGDGMFRVAPLFESKHLEAIFRHKVFKMLLSKGRITEDMVDMGMNWRHSGFNVFCGPRIQPGDEKAMENLARYIIRASFSRKG